MTMQVFALLGSVTPPPAVSQGQVALTDYSEGQQQSYSEDLAALLASMENAPVQLDTGMQQLPAATQTTEPAQELVLSMQPQPLLFAPGLPAASLLTVTTPAELSKEPDTTAAAVQLAAVLSAELTTEGTEFSVSGLPVTRPQAATVTLPTAFPLVTQDAMAPVSMTLPAVQAQSEASSEWMSGLSQLQPAVSTAAARPLVAVAQNNMLNLNQTASAPPITPAADGSTPVSTLTAVSGPAASALPVWQADPLPVQSQHWGQRLVQMLADKVDLQLGLNVNKAMIRLDPPSLGSIELSVQLDGDRLTVQMHSSNTQLREAMGQGLEQLRASLQQKLGADVQIDLRMGSDSSSQQQQQKTPQQGVLQPEANFYAEPEMTATEPGQVNRQNLVNQLV